MLGWVLLLVGTLWCGGCGRLGFDAVAGDGSVLDDAPADAPPGSIVVTFGERPGAAVAGVTRDNKLYEPVPTSNYGGSTTIEVDKFHVGLLAFDLTSIPPTAQVVVARLTLETEAESSNDTIEAFRLLESWEEGSSDGATGTSSFSERMAGVPWSGFGASGASRGSRIAALQPIGPFATYTVALALPTVAGWVAQPSTNHGLALVVAGTDGVYFTSREGAAASRPV